MNEEIERLAARLDARAENAYLEYIAQSKRDECLGWEIKVERGTFGNAELAEHTKRGELLGRHRALTEAVNELRASISTAK
jgi:hypothetical protein